MRSSKICRTLIAAVVLLILINQALIYMLEPLQSSSSDKMWYGYQNQDEIDTIFVGSSLVSRSLDPDQYDSVMGTHSYNMGTNAQMFAQSYTAIETAWREHGIQNVILGIGYFEFQSSQGIGNEVAFYRARNHYSSFVERFRNDLRYIFSKENYSSAVSINYLFPWVYDHVTISLDTILENVQEKWNSKAQSTLGEPGNGFGNGDNTELDFNTLTYEETSSAKSQKENASSYDELAKICAFCLEKGIHLYVINMPLPEYYVVDFPEQYFERAEKIRQVCEENGTEYYDFNVSKPELFERKDSYYMDYEHMNAVGAEQFTTAVSELVRRVEAGENVSELFYTQEEYLHSVDRIVCVNYTYERTDSGLELQAYAYCGSDVEPEYRFSIWNENSQQYDVLQEYSRESRLLVRSEVLNVYSMQNESSTCGDGTVDQSENEAGKDAAFDVRIRVAARAFGETAEEDAGVANEGNAEENGTAVNDVKVRYYEEEIS